MPRIRIHFSKRGYASFISHMDLPALFSRAAARAGLRMERTNGFSPHPRLALCPPLPVGVEGLSEPADFWFVEWEPGSRDAWNRSLPDGIGISSAVPVDGVSLNKLCSAASYIVTPLGGASPRDVTGVIETTLRENGALLDVSASGDEVLVSSSDLERCGPSRMVKDLVSARLISGWGDLHMVRAAVGRWDPDGMRVIPLTEECPL
ncbi:MAG: TIGR03936 family radical SAM-associated protein [Synergistaceae bacterium]|jgi:uncharacterized protein (DUF2344 family)|nr:TIGR03936 family radical SAM-associated protein [Synergistaceae bacterium]